MPILVTKSASKDQKKCGLTDADISLAVSRAKIGLIDNDIGFPLIKQELSRSGEGRKTACRAIVAFKAGVRPIVLHIFAKSRKANISAAEKRIFRDNASFFLALSDEQITKLIAERGWKEIEDGDKGQEHGGEKL